MHLQSKVAIVTGSATGIGRAIALAMAHEGAAVTIDYVGQPNHASETVSQIEGGVTCVKHSADTS